MSADLLAFLDQLDEARAAGTPGEWMADSHELYVNLGAALTGIPGDWIGETCRVDDPRSDADAALIVAAVNALPKLTAALRGVLDLAGEMERRGHAAGEMPELRLAGTAYRGAATRVRAAVSSALTPESVPS